MKKYLIDINIISYLADVESRFHEHVRACFRALAKDDEVCLSILSLYELYYSLSRANDDIDPKILRTKEKVFATLMIVPLNDVGARIFGELKTTYQNKYHLPRTALVRDTVDLMIASSALETGSILVSHDQVFRKVQAAQPRLQLEDWAV
jgi:predicted nucleic acid-binding protein